MLGEVSLLGGEQGEEPQSSSAAAAPLYLNPQQVAIAWRGDARYVATLVQPSPPAGDGNGGGAPLNGSEATQRAVAAQPALDAVAGAAAAGAAGPSVAQSRDYETEPTPVGFTFTQRQFATASAAPTWLTIWRRDGCTLHAAGERLEGLLPVAAWQPNGRHLYVGQATRDGPRVVLFETNGLQHGGFHLAPTGVTQCPLFTVQFTGCYHVLSRGFLHSRTEDAGWLVELFAACAAVPFVTAVESAKLATAQPHKSFGPLSCTTLHLCFLGLEGFVL